MPQRSCLPHNRFKPLRCLVPPPGMRHSTPMLLPRSSPASATTALVAACMDLRQAASRFLLPVCPVLTQPPPTSPASALASTAAWPCEGSRRNAPQIAAGRPRPRLLVASAWAAPGASTGHRIARTAPHRAGPTVVAELPGLAAPPPVDESLPQPGCLQPPPHYCMLFVECARRPPALLRAGPALLHVD